MSLKEKPNGPFPPQSREVCVHMVSLYIIIPRPPVLYSSDRMRNKYIGVSFGGIEKIWSTCLTHDVMTLVSCYLQSGVCIFLSICNLVL